MFNNQQSGSLSHFNQQESNSIKSEEDDNKNNATYHDPEDYFEMDIQSVQDSLMMEVKEQKSNTICSSITDGDINNIDTKNIPYNKGKDMPLRNRTSSLQYNILLAIFTFQDFYWLFPWHIIITTFGIPIY